MENIVIVLSLITFVAFVGTSLLYVIRLFHLLNQIKVAYPSLHPLIQYQNIGKSFTKIRDALDDQKIEDQKIRKTLDRCVTWYRVSGVLFILMVPLMILFMSLVK